jgi:phosphoribosyl 1,2-cyclic phosphate phosphodiesterase
VSQAIGGPVPIHARSEVLDELQLRFDYAFAQSDFYRPIAAACPLVGDIRFGSTRARFVDQPHGGPISLGIRFDEGRRSVGYAVDFSELSDDMASLYEGVDVWIADCLTRQPHPTHMHLDGVLSAARDLKVGHVYLVHMGNGLDYRSLVAELPDWAEPGYDGLEFTV